MVLFRLRRFWFCDWVPFSFVSEKKIFWIFLHQKKTKFFLSTFLSIKGKERKMDPSFPRLPPVGDKRTPATTPLRPPSTSDTGASGNRRCPKQMITCTCAESSGGCHPGCEGQIAVDLLDARWFRNKNNPKKNWYCPHCWNICLGEYGGGSC